MNDWLVRRRELADTVYEPAEDSYLLKDVAVERIAADHFVLDLGCGTGFIGHQVSQITGAKTVGVDINPYACRSAYETGLVVVRGNLLDPLDRSLFDVVVFNPPYLPTEPSEERDDWMEHALSGGRDGRRVIEPFLDDVGRVLADGGFILLLVSTLTDVDEVIDRADDNGLQSEVLAERPYPFESLIVLEFRRGE